MKVIGFPLLQVFSVSIQLKQRSICLPCTVDADGTIKATGNATCLGDQEQYVKLYGTIDVRLGPYVTHILYEQSQDNPELIDPKNDTITLSGPSSDVGCPCAVELEMQFHLRDAHQNLEVSRGWMELNCNQPECYYDKRLSSICQGEHGWATLHYTLFRKAVQALVTVKLIINGGTRSSACVVFGSLYVRYGGHDYSYEYQRKYYRIMLFNKSADAGVSLHGDSIMLPIPASCVAVPRNTSLIIEGDLHVKYGETEIATLRNIDAEIPQPEEIDSTSFKNIVGESALLEVTISWSNAQVQHFKMLTDMIFG